MRFLILFFIFPLSAQVSDPVTGTWRGSSICQVKDSPCHDEIAVYHASKLPGSRNYKFQMNKMVNGKEEEMGPLNFVYNDTLKTLTATSEGRATGLWKFSLKGKTMHGTLTINGNTLYRIIDLNKD